MDKASSCLCFCSDAEVRNILKRQAAEETARRLAKAERAMRKSIRSNVCRMLALNVELHTIAYIVDVPLEEVQNIAVEIKEADSAASNDASGEK